MTDKRFDVCSFPSLYGTPWSTPWRGLAMLFALLRALASGGRREIRIIDHRTDEHTVWL